MDREILLYVPVLPDLREYWQIPARELAALVGGTTAIPSTGLRIDDKGQLVQDQIVLLQSIYQQEDQPTVTKSVERLAQQPVYSGLIELWMVLQFSLQLLSWNRTARHWLRRSLSHRKAEGQNDHD